MGEFNFLQIMQKESEYTHALSCISEWYPSGIAFNYWFFNPKICLNGIAELDAGERRINFAIGIVYVVSYNTNIRLAFGLFD